MGLAALLLSSTVLAACGGSSGHAGRTAAGSETTSSAPVAETTPVSTNVTASTGTSSRGPSGSSKASPASSGRQASSSAQSPSGGSRLAAVSPAAAGTYRYDTAGGAQATTGVTQNYTYSPITSLVVDAAKGNAQRSVRDVSDANGDGIVTEIVVQYQPDGVHLQYLKVTTTFDAVTDVREFQANPQPLILATGAKPGDHWEFSLTGTGTTLKVAVDVQRTERLTIAGTAVDTLLVRTTSTFSGEVQGTSVADNWFVPQDRLSVKEHVVVDGTASLNRLHSDYTATLQRLAPS